MVIETITILYYSIATLSISLVLCQKYNKEISVFFNKWVYKYDLVSSNDTDDGNITNLELDNSLNDSNETYILFNENTNTNTNDININDINDTNNTNNTNTNNTNTNIKTKKNVVINFE